MDTHKPRTWLRAILIVSLALNVFFVGAFAARYHYKSKFMHKMPPEVLYKALGVLDEEYRLVVKTILDEETAQIGGNFESMIIAFQGMRTQLISPGLNPEDIAGFKGRMLAEHAKMADTFTSTMTRIAKALPEEQRIKYIDAAMPEFPPFVPMRKARDIHKKMHSGEK